MESRVENLLARAAAPRQGQASLRHPPVAFPEQQPQPYLGCFDIINPTLLSLDSKFSRVALLTISYFVALFFFGAGGRSRMSGARRRKRRRKIAYLSGDLCRHHVLGAIGFQAWWHAGRPTVGSAGPRGRLFRGQGHKLVAGGSDHRTAVMLQAEKTSRSKLVCGDCPSVSVCVFVYVCVCVSV